jgi:hypothetical protein
MATGQARPITVTLNYKFGREKAVSAKPTIDSLLKANRLKKGKLITFKSRQGDLKLLLEPKSVFQPATFQTGDDPVLVTKVPRKVSIWCGGKFLVRNYPGRPEPLALPREVRITPRRNRLGVQGDVGHGN